MSSDIRTTKSRESWQFRSGHRSGDSRKLAGTCNAHSRIRTRRRVATARARAVITTLRVLREATLARMLARPVRGEADHEARVTCDRFAAGARVADRRVVG